MRNSVFKSLQWLMCLAGAVFAVNLAVPAAMSDELPQVSPANTRDPRLPPVLPGESVETASGAKMKVWSSSGGVSVGQPPPPGAPPAPPIPGSVDVYVDKRSRPHPHNDFVEEPGRERYDR